MASNTTDPTPPAVSPRRITFRPIGAVALAAAMVWSTSIAASTWRDIRKGPEKHTIRITGSAKKRIVSDLIQWEATVESRAPERTIAYRTLRESRDKAVAFLVAQGIKPEEIQPQSAEVKEEFEKVVEDKVLQGATVPVRTEKQVSKGS
jgi:hypothetical protein